ncbi:PDR/VanB family oxidoreductase [Paenarthrobacter sp. PH39-S1]|uniref:PDR/VanB family oxidoreductase n=1 Tax=Paenarthrobacter sp. PH39-S1 TaxID=3046204 RepID=UPI0024BB2BF7|nr:PDR/VanB family oxidoreductase [Paenarthrobacter sp. PH39-S1]MDJ0356222.1 PDR/VanB family oxidoreductase [Paenarthrobacter sp. PH39-S1]
MKTAEFFDVNVSSISRESDCVVSLTLQCPLGGELPQWEPGAHVDLMLPNGVMRQYSLCSETGQADWRVAVLREPAGRGGSAFVHDELRPGTKVQVRPPRNNFALVPAPEYLFIAGGIGITPILPMIRRAAETGVPWRLVYLGRSRNSMAFLNELEAYGGSVHIHADDESGLFPLAELLHQPGAGFHLYTCGPGPLLKIIQSMTGAWADASRFHFERFVPDPADAGAAAAVVDGDHDFTVELSDGSEVEVPAGTTVLKALEGAGLPVLSSCQEGICGTCETAVVSGEIDHRDSLLSEDERLAGDTMMICVSRCKGKRLVLDL